MERGLSTSLCAIYEHFLAIRLLN